jgi:hypothetical protein
MALVTEPASLPDWHQSAQERGLADDRSRECAGTNSAGHPTSGQFALVFLMIAAGVYLAVVHPILGALPGGALVSACLLVSYVVARGAVVAMRIYVVFIALWFLAAPLIGTLFPAVSPGLSSSQLGAVWVTVAVWLLGWSSGQLLVRRRAPRELRTGIRPRYNEAISALIFVGVVALLIEISQVLRGATAYATQVAGGVNTSLTGTIGTLAAPAITAAFVLAWPTASRQGKYLLVLLVLAQMGVGVLSGFRGPAIQFPLGVAIAYFLVHPINLRHKALAITGILLLIVVVGIPLTLIANLSRQQQASAVFSSAPRLTLATLPRTIIQRLDEAPFLASGIGASGPAVKQAVRMDHQIEILVPRPLWPQKPNFNYGEQISTAVYDLPSSYNTSSTVTWLGDLYLNGGLVLVLFVAILLGAVARSIFERAVEGGVLAVLTAVLLLEAVLNAESPLVLGFAGSLRSLLLLGAACFVAAAFRRGIRERYSNSVSRR